MSRYVCNVDLLQPCICFSFDQVSNPVHHLQSSKEEKYNISEIVVDSLNSKGVRFLRENEEGGWFEISHNDARKKVSQALRERPPKGILKDTNHEAIDIPLNDGTKVADPDEVLNLASTLLTVDSRPLTLTKGDRISTSEFTELMNEPIRMSSGNWSTVLPEASTEPIWESVNQGILDGQVPDVVSIESDAKDQEPTKTQG